MFVDTHAHVNFNAFKDDGEAVLLRCLEAGMSVVNVGSQYSTSKRAVEYAHKFANFKSNNLLNPLNPIESTEPISPLNPLNPLNPIESTEPISPLSPFNPLNPIGIYAAVGIHPVHLKKGSFTHTDPEELTEEEIPTVGETFDYTKYLELARDEKVVAIGEVGLDYHHFQDNDDVQFLKNLQKETLLKFIELANEVQKPAMIHCWGVKSSKELDHARTDAYDDLLEILEKYPLAKRGIIHSFIGSYKTANKFIALGYKLGLNGIITYGDGYDRLIRELDLKNIVLETDCPYLAPRPLEKGTRNEPLFVEQVAQKIAEVKSVSIEEVAKVTSQNAKEILQLS
jgi:TatD DNase family protein